MGALIEKQTIASKFAGFVVLKDYYNKEEAKNNNRVKRFFTKILQFLRIKS